MNFSIINAGAEHLGQIEQLENECFSLPWTRDYIRSQLPDAQHIFLVAVSGERLLGYVGMMYVLDEGYISNVAVAKSRRRQGIADALIDELTRRAAKLSLAFMTLEVRESNVPAIALYKKHGFTEVGKRKNYYELPREDALLMTKFLHEQEATH